MPEKPKPKPAPHLVTKTRGKTGASNQPKNGLNIVSGARLAEVLGVSDRWVRELADAGYAVKVGYGKYDLPRSVQGAIRRVRETEVKVSEPPARADFDFERARKLKIENDTKENLLVPVGDAVAAVDAIVGRMRTALCGVPARVSDEVTVRRRVETEIDSVLRELAVNLDQAGRTLATGGDALAADDAVDA